MTLQSDIIRQNINPRNAITFGGMTKQWRLDMNILAQKISGVYEIVNTINGHKYIGSSVNIKRRWERHKGDLRRGVHHSLYLQRAWNKYGADCFKFSILEQCDKSSLVEREQYYLGAIQPEYNIASNATGLWDKERAPWNKGKTGVYSEKTLQEMSAARKGRIVLTETRQKISNALKGHAPWNKGFIPWNKGLTGFIPWNKGKKGQIPWNKGIPQSEEARQKNSESHKGQVSGMKGKKASEETRRKQSEVRKGRVPWNKGKRKVEDID